MAIKITQSTLRALRERRDRASFWSLASIPGLPDELRAALEAALERRYLEWWDHHLEPLLKDLERPLKPERKPAPKAQ